MAGRDDDDTDLGPAGVSIPRTLTESERFKIAEKISEREREQHAARWASGIPAVAGTSGTWEPRELMESPPTDAELELMHQLRAVADRPHRLAEFVARLTLKMSAQRRDEISANEAMLQELRDLLNRPPNGRVGELTKLVQQLAHQISEHGRQAVGFESRLDELEMIPKAINRRAWNTVFAIIGTILVSAAAIYGAIISKGEERGRQLEQMEMIRWRLDRLDGQPRHDEPATRWLVPPQPPQSKDSKP